MTTAEELLMKSSDALLQGTAVEKTIMKCVPQVKKPKDLLSIDVDYLLTCIRKVTFGDILPIKYKCKGCGEAAKEHDYEISLSSFISKAKELTKEDYENCVINLRDTFSIKIKPATYKDIIALSQYQFPKNEEASEEKVESINNFLTESICAMVEKVNSISNKDHIREFIKGMYSDMKEELSDELAARNNWGVEFKHKIKCKDCKKEEDISMYLNPTTFFMLPSSRKTKQKSKS
jgi:hypothetical protein